MIKKLFFSVLAITMLFNMTILRANDTGNKVELNQSGIVRNAYITEPDLNHGEITRITFEYQSVAGVNVDENSIITIKNPATNSPLKENGDIGFYRMFTKDEPHNLIHSENGVDYLIGIMYVEDDTRNIIMEFNENVKDWPNFKGDFFIDVRATFSKDDATGNSGSELPENVKVTNERSYDFGLNIAPVDYSISHTHTVGSSPFFYKPGGVIWEDNPDQVNWWLHINRNQESFEGDITIDDRIHGGHEFRRINWDEPISVTNIDKNFFKIIRENDEGGQELSPQEFIDGGYGSFEFTAEDSFSITIYEEQAQPNYEYTVRYITKVTQEGKYQKYFYNDAVGTYTENGEIVVKEQLNREAINVFAGGDFGSEKDALKIVKIAVNGQLDAVLPNTSFKLFHADGTPVSYLGTNVFVTDQNGIATALNLEPGKYYVTELSAPDYVTFDPTTQYPFEILEGENTGVTLVISNDVKTFDIDVTKVWEDDLIRHEEVVIHLLADGKVVDSVVLTDGKTTHTFTNLPEYKVTGEKIEYTVSEDVPAGYTNEITGNTESGFVVTNTIVKPDAVISAEKLVSEEEVRVNTLFTYTINVKNTTEGSDPLLNVLVSDILPEGVIPKSETVFVNGIKSDADFVNNKLEVTIPRLAYGEDVSITFDALVEIDEYKTYINEATITNPEDPDNPVEVEVPVTVIPNGKLSASKLVSEHTVEPLTPFEYTIVVKNTKENSNPLKNVLVFDELPEGINFVDSKIYVDGIETAATIEGNSFSITLDTVEFGTDVKVSFLAQASEGTFGTYENTATVTDPENPLEPEEPTVPVEVIPKGLIDVEKLVSEQTVGIEEVFTYTIKVKNITEGSHPIDDIRVADRLPEGLVFASDVVKVNGVEANSYEIVDNTLALLLNGVAYGEEYLITFDVYAQTGTSGTLINKAIVQNPNEPDPHEPTVPVTVTPNGKLEATKTASKSEVRPLEEFTYTITIKNIVENSRPLKNVEVSDTLPDGISFVDNQIYINGNLSDAIVFNKTFTYVLPEVVNGEDIEISFKVVADAGEFGRKINTAIIQDPEQPDPETPTVPVDVVPAGKILATKAVSQDEVKPLEVFEYTITVSNTVEGSDALKNILVSDTLPEGLEFVDKVIYVNGTEHDAKVTENTFELTLDSLSYDEIHTIVFSVRALEGEFGERVNVATISHPELPEPEEPEVPVTIVPDANITAEKLASKDVIKPNEQFTYSIIVENTVQGSKAVNGIVVEDTLPEGLSFVDGIVYVNDREAATANGRSFSVVLNNVAYGEQTIISFEVKADEETFGTKVNKAIVTVPEDPEPKEPTVPVDVVPDNAFDAVKRVSQESVKPLEAFTYSIMVSNTVEGSDPIKNIIVKDTLPEGLVFTDGIIYVDGVASDVIVNGNMFELTLSEVAYGNAVEITFEVMALEGEFGQRINTAIVTDPENPDPKEPTVPVEVTPDGKVDAKKLVSKDIVRPLEAFEYTIVVSNTVEGSNPIKLVNVTDTLPEGLEFFEKVVYVNGELHDAQFNNETVSLQLEDVAYGETYEITFKVLTTVEEPALLVNKAIVHNPEEPEPKEPTVPVEVIPFGKISAEKKVDSKSAIEVEPDEEFKYTITVKNIVKGSSALKDVVVSDVMPEGITFTDGVIYVDNEPTGIVAKDGKFSVTLPSLEYGTSVEVSFMAKALEGVFGTKINTARVVNPLEEEPEEPTASVDITPDGKLDAEKLVSKEEVKPLEAFEYAIIVRNTVEGSDPLENVIVQDTLPDGLTFTDGIIYVDGVASDVIVNGNMFELTLQEVAYGRDVEVTFEVMALEGEFGERVNVATVTDPNNPDPEEPTVPVEITPDGKLDAEKLVSKEEVKPLEAFEYTIIVRNTVEGSDPLENVIVQDTLPDGLAFTDRIIYVDGVASDVIVSGNMFELTLSEVAYGSDVEVTFEVMALEGEFGERVNVATVTDPNNPDPEEPTVPVEITPDGKLDAEKLVSKEEVKPLEAFEYTIIVRNTVEGSDPLENVIVQDTLPDGLAFTDRIIYVDGVASDVIVNGNMFELTLQEVAYGSDVEVTFEVIASKGAEGQYVNVATVTDPNNPDPEEPTVPVVVIPFGQMKAEKHVSKATVVVDEPFEYSIVVHNTKKDSHPLENVVVQDTLPKGLVFTDGIIYVDGKPTSVNVVDNSFEVIIDQVHYGQEVTVSFMTKAIENFEGVFTNVATVIDPNNPDDVEEPEVPVEVLVPPVVDDRPPVVVDEEPPTPSTGIQTSYHFLIVMMMSLLVLIGLFVTRKKQHNI